MTRAHPFFGQLTPDAEGMVDWETTRKLGSREVRLELHLDALDEVSSDTLDQFARLFGELPRLDHDARAAIAQERSDPGSATSTYVDFIKENFEEFADADVASNLVPVRVWGWFDGEFEPEVFLDYSFAPERLDHVLCAQFDADAQLVQLEVES